MSVKNFSPELMNIFSVGSERKFEFDCGSEKAAHALRARLHNLRREMRKEKHWLTSVAEGVVISIPKDKPTFIVAQPPDNNILEELQKALAEQGGDIIEKNKPKFDNVLDHLGDPISARPTSRDEPDKITEKAESAIYDYLKGKENGKKG